MGLYSSQAQNNRSILGRHQPASRALPQTHLNSYTFPHRVKSQMWCVCAPSHTFHRSEGVWGPKGEPTSGDIHLILKFSCFLENSTTGASISHKDSTWKDRRSRILPEMMRLVLGDRTELKWKDVNELRV